MYIEKLLIQISQLLTQLKIPYLITGSIAYSVYAIPRSTRDIDIILEISEDEIAGFINAIKGKYYYHEQTIHDEIKRKGMFNIIDLESSYKIDLIVLSNDPFEQAKFLRRKILKVFGVEVHIISLEDLIISKLRWIQQLDSELHKRDIEALLQNTNADKAYIKQWCEYLNLKTFNLIE